ncbi:glycosyltransferase family 4 protein [Paenibacillus sp. CF384]|uniref:glycosyltransferase family 4 protein n=1 Tax=Paenibacillus sp. CF384 TaxID=1884382 RepID=UPI000897EA38|nr:glycosyltransferase family 4 protein [Paenibacillus sp. CF384]SDX96960.1 Glycosyltransferase involved in cell wall bisynthesis [Paenibacillus sp. CF384]
MKILLATFWQVPHVGGVWKYMMQLKERLELMGHQVDLLGTAPDKVHMPGLNKEIAKEALRPLIAAKLSASRVPQIHVDPYVMHCEYERYYLELAAAYFGLEQYDIIHTHDIFAARALRRVKSKGTALVAHVHGSVAIEVTMNYRLNPQLGVAENSPAWNYFNGIEHYGATSGDVTVTANNWQKQLLMNTFGVPEERIKVFPYGLDIDAFERQARKGTTMQRPPSKKIIICPARLSFVKGIDILIAALGILKWTRRDWVCWIVGDGEQRAELEQLTAAHQLQQDVLFLGVRDDIPGLLRIADIFVHSCIQDNQPFSLMEAQVAGLPSLVSTAGGLPEMVEHEVTGLISPVRDSVKLAEQLGLLLANDSLREQLGHNARIWGTAHWSMDKMMERVLDVYQSVMKK